MSSSINTNIGNDVKMPMVGFGTYLIPENVTERAVTCAIDCGYRHIDTAEKYENEQGVGDSITKAIKNSTITRDDIFVTTKVWPGNTEWSETQKTYESTLATMDQSLHKLQINYVDLYLIHAPFDREHRIEQWRALVELQKQGKTRAIGVSNFNKTQIEDLTDNGLPLPAVNQIELHPWSQKPGHISYLEERGITAMAYSSLAPLSTWRVAEGQGSGKTSELQTEAERKDSVLKIMAEKYNVAESQLLLRWAIQKGFPVIPKSTKPERIALNFDVFDFTIEQSDMQAIEKIDREADMAWGQNFFDFKI